MEPKSIVVIIGALIIASIFLFEMIEAERQSKKELENTPATDIETPTATDSINKPKGSLQ